MWRRMLHRWLLDPSDDELKAAAQRETERLRQELERLDVRVELATFRRVEELEQELRRLMPR